MGAKEKSEAYWYAFLDALERERQISPGLDVVEWARQYRRDNPQEGS